MRLKSISIISMILMVLIISCARSKSDQDNRLKLIFITTCVEEDFFKPVKNGMSDAAKAINVDCTFSGTRGVNVAQQVKMVQDALNKGYDGIALNIIDSVAFDKVVEEAMSRGIPVVSFNVDDDQTQNARMSTVVQDHFTAGKLFGEKLLNIIPANCTVLATQHSEGITALDNRLAGMKQVLKQKNINFKVIITSNEAEKAANIISQVLEDNPEIDAVFCTGLADTEGACMAMDRSDRKLPVAGFDLSPNIVDYIKKGTLIFTVDQQPYMQGYYPVIQLTQYLRYGIIPSNNEIGASFVTRENVDKVATLIQEGYR